MPGLPTPSSAAWLPLSTLIVLCAGVPRYGDEAFRELFERCGVAVEPITVDGRPKLVEAPLAAVADRVGELTPEALRFLA